MKLVLEFAVVYPKSKEKRDAALDVMFDKLTVIPLQKAWRSKSTEQKAAISSFIKRSLEETNSYDDKKGGKEEDKEEDKEKDKADGMKGKPCDCCYSSRWFYNTDSD